MKTVFILLMGILACFGCQQKPDSRDAKIEALEKRLAALEVVSPPRPISTAIVSAPIRTEAELPKATTATPPVLNVQGRMIEQNEYWCKWSTITTVANTNEEEARYRLYIQFLDKDGFPIDESDFTAVTPPMSTNKVTDIKLINSPSGRNVKSFKAYTYAPQH